MQTVVCRPTWAPRYPFDRGVPCQPCLQSHHTGPSQIEAPVGVPIWYLRFAPYFGADDIHTLYTFVDASFAVHEDMKSHTGGVITFGHGGIAYKSAKQKLVTKSSTEAELVGASDYLPSTLWVQHFLQAQGFPHVMSYFEQDNQSAMRLERNGRASAGQRSRHINIRYFFITDRLDTDNITLRYCQTEHMLADFLSKPLQGNLFRKFRDVLLGLAHVSSLRVPSRRPGVPLGSSGQRPWCRCTHPG